MTADRPAVMVDACALVPALNRNLLLSLAEAELFRLQWSARVLDETERAIARMLARRGDLDAAGKARKARAAMERAFEDAMVAGYERLIPNLGDLPDTGDAHVVAAALKARASVIVTENVRHFPGTLLQALDLEVKTTDSFLADTIAVDAARAVAAVRRMRERLNRPERTLDALLTAMDSLGLRQTVDALRGHLPSL